MVTRATQTIGLVVTDIQNPFFAHLARGVEDAVWEQGYTLILANTDENLERENAILISMQEKMVDGLILVPASSRPLPQRNAVVEQGIPMVLLDRASEGLQVDTVLVDNERGAFLAVSHLISLGHQRIGMIVDNLDITTNEERLAGYRAALEYCRLPFEPDLVQSCQITQQSAYSIATQMLRQQDRPSAFFTTNNLISIGALNAIHEIGLNVPQDISIVGFDDFDWSQLTTPKFTVVMQPVYAMGRVIGERLLSRLNGDASPAMLIRMRTEFILRSSSGPLRLPVAASS